MNNSFGVDTLYPVYLRDSNSLTFLFQNVSYASSMVIKNNTKEYIIDSIGNYISSERVEISLFDLKENLDIDCIKIINNKTIDYIEEKFIKLECYHYDELRILNYSTHKKYPKKYSSYFDYKCKVNVGRVPHY